MLFIDPHQPPERVNAMMNISDISGIEETDAETVMNALNGCFDFNKDTISDGHFRGTFLRFPLREEKSELSENLYNDQKITDLFEGFQTEISTLLLFLKNLESIEVCRRISETTEKVASSEIIDQDGTVREKRDWFNKKLKVFVGSDPVSDDIECSISMQIKTTTPFTVIQKDWQLVNYVIGKSASVEFQVLMNDSKLGYSPYVGLALCQDSGTKTEGHVFCFLPLPKEGAQLSGLPFHVNGFFALSKDRHHLKWATDEQKGKEISDKSILWNERMVKEALPKAYEILLRGMISMAVGKNNDETAICKLYQIFIDMDDLRDDKWKCLAMEALKRVKDVPLLFCGRAGKWVSFSEAIFAFFSNEQAQLKSSIQDCLGQCHKNYVDISHDRYKALNSYYCGLTMLSPSVLASYLHENNNFTQLSSTVKIDILAYLLSDSNPETVTNLELLPLANGYWAKFNAGAQHVYICPKEEVDLLPGMEEFFVEVDARLERQLSSILEPIILLGMSSLYAYKM